jgi:hypothetical protein
MVGCHPAAAPLQRSHIISTRQPTRRAWRRRQHQQWQNGSFLSILPSELVTLILSGTSPKKKTSGYLIPSDKEFHISKDYPPVLKSLWSICYG